jgi:hypothetical protein
MSLGPLRAAVLAAPLAAGWAAGLARPALAQAPAAPAPAQGGGAGSAQGSGQGTGQAISPPDAWVPRQVAELILLEKVRAQPSTLTIRVGQTATFGPLTIAVKACAVRPPDLPANAAAFVEVTDSRGSAPVFKGWILANTPAVSQLEHPLYDLRLAACR